MSGTPPTDPAAGAPAPHGRAARTAPASSGGPGTPAGPVPPPAGPATQTSPAAQSPPTPTPRGTQPPDGRPCGEPAPDRGRQAWKAAESAHKAAKLRQRFTRAPKRTGPGMIRKMPVDNSAPDSGVTPDVTRK